MDSLQWKFSAQQLVDEMREFVDPEETGTKIHEYNVISSVIYYLETKGVCEEHQYLNNVGCARVFELMTNQSQYILHGKDRLNEGWTNQYVLDNLIREPIYIQIGIHPKYYQFYSPLADEPIHAGYIRPSYAGVLTGYNLATKNEEYWEVYIRRHGANYNKVKVACKFEKNGEPQLPFGGLSSKMYHFIVTDTQPANRVELKLENGQQISTTEELEKLVEEITGTKECYEESVVLFVELLDCNRATDMIEIASAFPKMTSLILVGNEDQDYSCLDFFSSNTLEEFIDMTPEEYAGIPTTTRRLEEIDTLAEKTIEFVGKSLISIKYGSNKYNNYRYNFVIKGTNAIES